MSSDNDPLELRRAQFRDAVRRDDALAAARAAARLRAHARQLGARDFETMRASRQMFGRAIRDARVRRASGPIRLDPEIAIPLAAPRRIPYALIATIAVVGLVFGALLAQPLFDVSEQDGGGGGGAPAAAVSSDAPILVSALSRGRVVLADVAVASAIVEPAPTAEPEPSASASPAPTTGVGAGIGSPSPSGSGGPGTGTGTGSGNGNGSGTSSPSPAPTATRSPAPTLTVCFVSIPRGFARLCGQVIDARTGRAIAGACVSLGACTDQSARTDSNGRWAFVLPVGDGSLQWGLEFAKAGYLTTTYTQTSRQGFITIPTQRLVAAP